MLNFNVGFSINYLNNLNSLGKITVFLISWAVIWLPILSTVLWFTTWQKSAPNPNTRKLTLILSLYSIAPILLWGVIKVEKTSWREIGIIWQVSLFQFILFGYCLSIATLFMVYGIQLVLGWLQWKQKPRLDINFGFTLIALLLVSFVIGSIEELIFRGVLVHFLATDYSVWLTAIISSTIFALLHLILEQKNTIPQLPGLWLMGLVLFYACIITDGSLGLAIGLHSGWVLILACVDTFDLYTYNPNFPGWIIGKKDQPLGSIVGLIVLFLTTIFLLIMNHGTIT
jgi:hypothetical protein